MHAKIELWSPPTQSSIAQSYLPKNFALAKDPPPSVEKSEIIDERDFPEVAYASRPQDMVP